MPASKNSQRGAAIVEFCLILPLLLMIVFGIIEFSALLYDNAVITNASREAAREWIEYRSIPPLAPMEDDDTNPCGTDDGPDDLDGIVQDYCRQRLITFRSDSLSGTCDEPVTSVGIKDNTGAFTLALHPVVNGHEHPVTSGDLLIVKVDYTYNFLFMPIFIRNLLPTFTLSAQTVMRAE